MHGGFVTAILLDLCSGGEAAGAGEGVAAGEEAAGAGRAPAQTRGARPDPAREPAQGARRAVTPFVPACSCFGRVLCRVWGECVDAAKRCTVRADLLSM